MLTIRWAIGDLPQECRFLLNTQLMFLKKEKDPTSKQFDDDEWIRSLTEAQEITADVPEDSVMYDHQAVDPKKVPPIHMGELLWKCVSRRLLALSEGEIKLQLSRQHCDSLKLDPKVVPRLAILHQLLYNEWAVGSLTEPLDRSKLTRKTSSA